MNPRTLAWVSTGFAVISGIVAANLWRELRAERERTDALRAQLAGFMAGQPHAQLLASGGNLGLVVLPQNTNAALDTVALRTTGLAAINQEADSGEQQLLKDSEYRKAWLQVDGYATALAQAGVPLDGTQTRAIATALSDEQKSLKQDIVALARTVDLAIPQTQVEAQYALKRRQGESNQRVLDAVYPWLTAQQMYLLRGQIEQQDASRAVAREQERARQ